MQLSCFIVTKPSLLVKKQIETYYLTGGSQPETGGSTLNLKTVCTAVCHKREGKT